MALSARRHPRTFILAATATCWALTAQAQEREYERDRDHHGRDDDRPRVQAPVPIVYADANFHGGEQALTPGRYDVGQLAIGNDQLSSLRVPPGWSVTVYEHAGFRGRTRTFAADTPWVGNDFNDVASSLVVEGPQPVVQQQQPPQRQSPEAVEIFRDANFASAAQQLYPGRYDIGQIAIGNDQLSSLRVPPGWTVTLYEHAGWQGRSRQFQADTPWVGNDFNDITSSLLVEAPSRGRPGREERQPEQFAPPPPQPEDLASANLHLAHRVWRSDDPVLLDFFHMPDGDSFAWVTVVPANARDDEWGTWSYTSGAVNGQFNVGQLPPGEYEARAFTSAGKNRVADRLRFRVAP